jgi:hypothetical protein
MEKKFKLPLIECKECDSDQDLVVNFSGAKLKKLYIKCSKCNEEINLVEKSSVVLKEQKQKLKHLIKRLSKLIIKARVHIPKNKNELLKAIKNPKHPFTAAVIAALALLLMEMSGFGIFVALTWILGNLILAPVGWVLIPIVVVIVFTHRKSIEAQRALLEKNKVKKLRKKVENLKGLLEEKPNKGEMSKEDSGKER